MFEYILAGILQGIFEWIPISSEGILVLFFQLAKIEINPLDLALFLHLGTTLAAFVYFRKDWIEIFTFKEKETLKFLIIATIVSLIVSFPIYKLIKNSILGVGLLFLTGFGLLITSWLNRASKNFSLEKTELALLSGVLQGMSVIPGLSRSGTTIFALSLGKLKPSEILKLSYLMSVPVVLASNLYIFLFESGNLIFQAWPGLIFSFIVGILTLDILLKWSQKVNFSKFTLFFGILCIIGAFLSALVI